MDESKQEAGRGESEWDGDEKKQGRLRKKIMGRILRSKWRPCLGENEDSYGGGNDRTAGDEEKDEEKAGEEERKHFYLLIATIRRSRPLIRLPNDRVAPAL